MIRHNNSLIFNYLILSACLLGTSLPSFGFDLKRFDAPKIQRVRYLTFKSPTSLRYKEEVFPVDRTKLVMRTNFSSLERVPENNATVSAPEFPVITYTTGDDSSPKPSIPVLPQYSQPAKLPLADPFESLKDLKVGTTDQLLNIFDENQIKSDVLRMNTIPFIPPYTVAPDNLKIGTKATYRRVQR